MPETGETVAPISYSAARITGSLDVTGGVVESYALVASSVYAGDHYTARVYDTGSNTFSIPMIVGTYVTIAGKATILRSDGKRFTVPVGQVSTSYQPYSGCSWYWYGYCYYYSSLSTSASQSGTFYVGATGAAKSFSIDATSLDAQRGSVSGQIKLNGATDIVSQHSISSGVSRTTQSGYNYYTFSTYADARIPAESSSAER